MLHKRVELKCPYCGIGTSSFLEVEDLEHAPELKTQKCYKEYGGCGKTFVVEATITVTASAHRIEGL